MTDPRTTQRLRPKSPPEQIEKYKYYKCVCVCMAEKPNCPLCKSGEVYILADQTIVCRRCGTRTKPNDERVAVSQTAATSSLKS